MISNQTARIVKVTDDTIILQLPDNQKLSWPKDALPTDLKIDSEVKIFITDSRQLLNEIINGQEENRKSN